MHSKDILKQLESLLDLQFDHVKAKRPYQSDQEWDDFMDKVRAVCTDLRNSLFETLLVQTTVEAKQILVSDYVTYIANICLTLRGYTGKAKGHLPKSRLDNYNQDLRRACDHIADVMTFIQQQYDKYFDYDVTMPFSLVERQKAALRHAIDRVKPLYNQIGVDPALLDIALAPVRRVCKGSVDISYRQFAYLKRIVDKLAVLLERPLANPELEVHRALQSINFNHEAYIHYCKARLREKYPALNDKIDYLLEDQGDGEFSGQAGDDKNAYSSSDSSMPDAGLHRDYPSLLRIYRWYLKEQSQVDVEAGMYWDKNADSAVELLNRNINEEIKYVMDLIHLDEGYVNGIKLFSAAPKIPLSLSSPKSAAWLWSAKEAGIFKFNSHQEAVSLFCAHFSTAGAQDLSPVSFRSNYFAISTAAAGVTMDLVQKQKDVLRTKIG